MKWTERHKTGRAGHDRSWIYKRWQDWMWQARKEAHPKKCRVKRIDIFSTGGWIMGRAGSKQNTKTLNKTFWIDQRTVKGRPGNK